MVPAMIPAVALLLALAMASALVHPAPARAEAARVEGGWGGSLRPMENTDIRLKEELIRAQVHLDRVDFKVVYELVNTTDRPQTVRMGVPQRSAMGPEGELKDLAVTVDGRAEPTGPAPDEAEGREVDGSFVPAMDHHVFEVSFGPGQSRRVVNTYWVMATEYRGLWSCAYFLHTGAGWKGAIDTVDIFVSLDPELVFPGPALKAEGLDTAPAGYIMAPSGDMLSWHRENLEPTPADDLSIVWLHAGRPFLVDWSASSTLRGCQSNPRGPNYEARNVADGDKDTAWVEGVAGPGLGQWLLAEFLTPGGYEVRRVGVLPGYAKGEQFGRNNRLKEATLVFSDGSSAKIDLEDRPAMQFFEVGPVQTTFVKLIVDDVYRGSRYDDTCISEIQIYTAN